jgi:hypothetical protein
MGGNLGCIANLVVAHIVPPFSVDVGHESKYLYLGKQLNPTKLCKPRPVQRRKVWGIPRVSHKVKQVGGW